MKVYWVDFLHGLFFLKEVGTGRLLGVVIEDVDYDENGLREIVYRCEVYVPHKAKIGSTTSYVDAKKMVENQFINKVR